MLAIDTDIVVRYLTGDHPAQSAQARRLIDGNEVFVTTTVLLETAWVLQSVYACPVVRFTRAIRAFAGLPNVTLEDAGLAAEALDWADGGMDVADALHLSRTRHCNAFMTFDHSFARTAKKLGLPKVRAP